MIITKKALPRRSFLRGLGATIALPMLDAMVPALAQSGASAQPTRRLGYFYIPMGMNPAPWVPDSVGNLVELSPSLSSLAPFLESLNIISNLEIRNAYTTGNHASSNCAFLSCAKALRTEGTWMKAGGMRAQENGGTMGTADFNSGGVLRSKQTTIQRDV